MISADLALYVYTEIDHYKASTPLPEESCTRTSTVTSLNFLQKLRETASPKLLDIPTLVLGLLTMEDQSGADNISPLIFKCISPALEAAELCRVAQLRSPMLLGPDSVATLVGAIVDTILKRWIIRIYSAGRADLVIIRVFRKAPASQLAAPPLLLAGSHTCFCGQALWLQAAQSDTAFCREADILKAHL